jgi:hypothetical protein
MNHINGDNLNSVRQEASRHFRNKKREYLKDKMNELATYSKDENIRDVGLSMFERQPLIKFLHKYLCCYNEHIDKFSLKI